uniref:DNA repair protein RecN n=1 Tax=candidate division WOR-3 bacterium TaxID=2052148 RepID=A0A7C4U6D3_UNCW3
MLKEIYIKNFALIEELRLEFDEGFIVFTGETGAGKSIIIKALSGLLGEKLNVDDIREGEKESVIEGVFSLSERLKKEIEEYGIENDSELIIKRIFTRDGKGSIYINNSKVSMKVLTGIGRKLFDIHGQHQHQLLLDESSHIYYLDRFGKIEQKRIEFGSLYDKYIEKKKELDDILKRKEVGLKKKEFLEYQIKEISDAKLIENEDVTLKEQLDVLSNFEKIKGILDDVIINLGEREESVTIVLSRVIKKLQEISGYDKVYIDSVNNLSDALSIIQDVHYEISRKRESLKYEPEEIERMNERLSLIQRLKKKYGGTIKEIIEYGERIKNEIEEIENFDLTIERIKKELEELELKTKEMSRIISDIRKEKGKEFQEVITNELKKLGFQDAYFYVEIKEKNMDRNGIDDVYFLFAPNVGEGTRNLKSIVSGGELSRVMLALKSVIGINDEVEGLVFDEIDVGISGRTAEIVGKKMKEIGNYRQVFCITHLPIIAALGDSHYFVGKETKKGRTRTFVKKLDGEERIKEIARMLGGEEITESAYLHAKKLIEMKEER